MPLQPLTPNILLRQTMPNIIGFSEGCTSVAQLQEGDDYQAPTSYQKLSGLGPVYRQFFQVQCHKEQKVGSPKKVIICWAGVPSPGLASNDITPGRPGINTPVWVSCSCNHFRYVCEWALSRYGSSDILYSNGKPAVQTNPNGIGTLCKHLYVTIPFAIRGWSGEAPEDKVVEEPAVEEVPQVPELPQGVGGEEEVVPEISQEEAEERENLIDNFFDAPRGASYSIVAQQLRSMALTFDAEYC